MFELRRLRLLHELSQRGTLAAVAQALSYSPSTVSQQLSQLEREAGVALLEADGRRVRLTAHGRALAAHAKAMLDLDERAHAEMERGSSGVVTVRVGAIHTAVHPLVSTALAVLDDTQPPVHMNVSVINPEIGLFELAARTFDVVIAEQYVGLTRAHHPDLDRVTVGLDPLRLAVPATDTAVTLADVRDRDWVLEPDETAARRWVTQQCRAAGFEPRVRFEVPDPQIHVQLISDGRAVGVLPDLVWAQRTLPLRLINLPGDPQRELFTATRRAAHDRTALQAVRSALEDAFLSLHLAPPAHA
jgi:DNA-binding transcriptional LysR family regulator